MEEATPLPEHLLAVSGCWGGGDLLQWCAHWQGMSDLETVLTHAHASNPN